MCPPAVPGHLLVDRADHSSGTWTDRALWVDQQSAAFFFLPFSFLFFFLFVDTESYCIFLANLTQGGLKFMAVLLAQPPVARITGVGHLSLAVLPFLLCVSFSVSAPHFTSLGSYSLTP